MPNAADRAAWTMASLIALVFGRVKLDERAIKFARLAPLARRDRQTRVLYCGSSS
jgi:hypothetical protein